MNALHSLRQRARELKKEAVALYLASRDPRTPWYAKALAACVVAYLFCPLDLIPDFIPVLGLVDDLLLIPLGIALVIRLIPPPILEDCRSQAARMAGQKKPVNWVAAFFVILIWVGSAYLGFLLLNRILAERP